VAIQAAAEERMARNQTKGSGDGNELVGILNIGNDIGRLPQRIRCDRLPADGPVSAFGGTGHADDIELHISAKRVALKRISDPAPDLIEGHWRFFKERLEVHVTPPAPQFGLPAQLCGGLLST
jgi:hypothetical protein